MKHSVFLNNAENHWDNALPLGNGVFGTMLYFEGGTLYMPLNHYEVYYNINDSVLPSTFEKEDLAVIADADSIGKEGCSYGEAHKAHREKADGNLPPEGEPFCEYRITREQARNKKAYGITEFSGSYPMTGDISFSFADGLKDADHTLTLSVEDACVALVLEKDGKSLSMETKVLREDCVLNEIHANEAGLLDALHLSFAPYRDLDAPDVRFSMTDESTLVYTVTRPLPPLGKALRFLGYYSPCRRKS